MARSKQFPTMKVILVLLNLMTTWLMIFHRLKESPIVAYATGKYNAVQQRFQTGAISYNIVEPEHFRVEDLPSPQQLANYKFLWTPPRDPSNIGSSRSVCLTINTNAAPVMMTVYNDFWGKGARRAQIWVNSISAPNCQVLNVKPEWRDQCVADHQGNATLCHQYVLDNFDALRLDRTIRMAVVKDIGGPGVPFLRCLGRPLVPFDFNADLLTHQTYWSGGSYHATLRTSKCYGVPLVHTSNQRYALFQTVNHDEACDMLLLLPSAGLFAFYVSWIHSFVSIILVIEGIALGLFHMRTVNYLPHDLRIGKHRRWLRYALPFMNLITKVSDQDRSIIRFKGSMIVASDAWMAHWLFIWLSIIEAFVNLRGTYALFEIAQQLLSFKVTLGNVTFLCGALIKIVWLLCLAQTLFRIAIKLGARFLRSIRVIRSATREKIEWNVDGISILLSYRIYYVMTFALSMILIGTRGSASFMERDGANKIGAYGGVYELAGFWGSEVACDFATLLGLLMIISLCIGIGLMFTNFKDVADNSVMRLLQSRYFVSGWDGLLAAHMLGLHPSDPEFFVDERAHTKLSIGSLLQVLYLSGPSGFVHLAGDYIFRDNGFSKDPVRFRFSVPKALAMGLIISGRGSVVSTTNAPNSDAQYVTPSSGAPASPTVATRRTREEIAAEQVAKHSIFARRLRLVSESYLGKFLFVGTAQPGQLVTNKETGAREYEVIDALTTMTVLDIKHLMGREKRIRVQ